MTTPNSALHVAARVVTEIWSRLSDEATAQASTSPQLRFCVGVAAAIKAGQLNGPGTDLTIEMLTQAHEDLLWHYRREAYELGVRATLNAIGVHVNHCCADHGCKYGSSQNCPVVLGGAKQAFPCEFCDDDNNGDGDTSDA